MDLGTYVEHDGRPAVRFERTYPHPVARLWAAITETGELSHWFPSSVAMESHVGGKIEFTGDPNIASSAGEILVFDPPHRLSYTWGGDELHFQLSPAGDNGCTLTLIEVLEAADTAARNAAGWTVCLAALDKHLTGDASTATEPWRSVYESYIAAGMPSGAWIPEGV